MAETEKEERMRRTLGIPAAMIAAVAITAPPMTAGISLVAAGPALAQKGDPGANGRGGGGGRGGDRGRPGAPDDRGRPPADRGKGADRSARPGGDGDRGRGAVDSALGAANAAHASQTALENASSDSMPGKLYAYQQTGGLTAGQIAGFHAARDELAALEALPEEDPEGYLGAYDTDGDGEISAEEAGAYEADMAALEDAVALHEGGYEALAAIGDGRLDLTGAALKELNRLLGLDPDAETAPASEGGL